MQLLPGVYWHAWLLLTINFTFVHVTALTYVRNIYTELSNDICHQVACTSCMCAIAPYTQCFQLCPCDLLLRCIMQHASTSASLHVVEVRKWKTQAQSYTKFLVCTAQQKHFCGVLRTPITPSLLSVVVYTPACKSLYPF